MSRKEDLPKPGAPIHSDRKVGIVTTTLIGSTRMEFFISTPSFAQSVM